MDEWYAGSAWIHRSGWRINMNAYQALVTPRKLCNRWQVSEATLKRWLSEGVGPIYVKLGGQVRYRQEDVVEYEASCLRRSTLEAI
jgi:predicted DNA-binding transcriptional regulator AlpA